MSEDDSQVLRLKDTHPTYKKFDALRRMANKIGITLSWNSIEQRFEVEDRSRPKQLFWLETGAHSCPFCGEHPVFPGVTEEAVHTELSVHTRVDPSVYAQENGDDY